MSAWSMRLQPEARREQVRVQLAESVRILAALAARRDLSASAFEMELRMQILWLTNAANQWHQAEVEGAQIQRGRELMLRREGPGQ